MKKKLLCLLLGLMTLSLFGCSAKTVSESEIQEESKEPTVEETADSPMDEGHDRILVVYFSCIGEQYQVGVIEEGNTAIVAKMIAEKTGADLYEVKPIDGRYDLSYSDLTDYAKKEQNDNVRPEYKDNDQPDLNAYDVIFIGAPVWWGDWPMIMYTFFENNVDQLNTKTLIPFSTHGGSGLAGFEKKLGNVLKDATILEGMAISGADAQNDRDGTEAKVNDWLNKLGY